MTGLVMLSRAAGCGGGGGGGGGSGGGGCGGAKSPSSNQAKQSSDQRNRHQQQQQQQVSIVELVLGALKKSMVVCRSENDGVISSVHRMEIGWPTNVQHLTHVTFDRFHGFMGLPLEFEVQIPTQVPSASVSVFGVSAESMQCSYDSKGNSVPIILLLMQERLHTQGGLKAEGIFRIEPENSHGQKVRDELNRGIVPDNIDVHCLASLIKTWFRELPSGVLDGLSPDQVLQCKNEEDYVALVNQLKPTETALLRWAIDLMADVVEEEEFNKMNARNIAMVFAPNMTRMSDQLTALMHAVQVMNLLKTLIIRTLREREEISMDEYSPTSPRSFNAESSDEDYDSQVETDDNNSNSTAPTPDIDKQADYIHYNDYEQHRNNSISLSDVEECFLSRLDYDIKKTTSNDDDAEISISARKSWSWRSYDTSLNRREVDINARRSFDSIKCASKLNDKMLMTFE